jgi:hypothetical protein
MAARVLKGKDPKAAKPSKPKILIFGAPGVGKTWGALDFPSTYYIDCEGGANRDHYTEKLKRSGGTYLGVEDGSLDMDVITEEIITLATVKHHYRTLVIDSYSKLFQADVARSLEDIQRKLGVDTSTFGREKIRAINKTRKWLEWFTKLDMNVILICHEKTKWVDSKEAGFTFDGWEKLEYELDLALHITKQGNTRKGRVVKSRIESFKDLESFDWSYATFADKYGRDVMEADAVAVVLASAEQIAEYNTLIATVKIDPKVIEKWNDAVDNVAELTVEDLQKRIDFLNKQLEKAKA